MKNFFPVAIIIILGLLAFFSLTQYAGWANILADLHDLKIWQWGIVVALNFGAVLLGALKWKMILAEKEIKASYFDLLRAYLVSNMVYFFAPMFGFLGEFSKTCFIKTDPPKKPMEILPSVLIDKTFLWLINGLAIFFALIYFLIKAGLWDNVLYVLLSLGVIAVLYFLAVKNKVIVTEEGDNPQPQKILEKFLLELKHFFEFFHNKNNLGRILPVALLEMSCSVAQTGFIAAFVLDKPIFPWMAVLIVGCIYMANLTMMPAGLGSTETASVVAFSALAFSRKIALSYAIVLRITEFLVALLGVIALLSLGVQRTKDMFKQSQIYDHQS